MLAAFGGNGHAGGMMSSPLSEPGMGAEREEDELAEMQRKRDDPHLRSVAAVEGYHIQATDGDIGYVEEADCSVH